MSVDLTTILEKIIHSTIRKKEIKEITFRIVEKMNKILNNKPNDEFNKENKPCDNKENVHVFYNKNDLSVNELRNEYYKLKGEIGFI